MTGPGLDDDEYHFTETGDLGAPSSTGNYSTADNFTSRGGVSPGADRFSRKNMMFGLGLLLVIFCGYKLANMMMHAHALKKAEQPIAKVDELPKPAMPTPAPAPAAVASVEKIPEPAKSVTVATASMTELSEHNKEINDKLEQFRSVNQNSLQQVESKVTALQTNLDTLQQQLAKNNEAMQALLQQSQKQQETIAGLLKAREKPKQMTAAKLMKKPTYFVRAVVPGRAWLQKGDGSSITVTYGDEIPNLGYVTRIDLGRGLVFMSEGDIISFSPDDR
jgi:intracellular multiplication protein IcmG